MSEENRRRGILIFEDGSRFEGFLFGAPVTAETIVLASSQTQNRARDRGYGEVVFNTSMTGYQEILTDPSYYGQIVVMTVPHVGNTGVNEEDPESSHPWCAGFVVHALCDDPASWRSNGKLDSYLKKHGIPGLYEVDTRSLTRYLRSMGVARGIVLPIDEMEKASELFSSLPVFEGRDLIGEVTTREPYCWDRRPGGFASLPASPKRRLKVVAMDFGVKWNLLRSLAHFGCDIEVVPAHASAEDVLSRKPDGIFLSNGPGDPSAAPYAAHTVKQLVGKVPLFGVCMGHQILALALGGRTYKLKFGHRGGNQPVLNKALGRVEISSHNHGYSVDATSLPSNVVVTHMNLNDKTVEGLEVQGARAFSVQYHPEACPGPHDSMELFKQFVQNMKSSAISGE